MTVILKVIALTFIIGSVLSLEQLQGNGDVLNKIIQLLSSEPSQYRRAVNLESLNKAKSLYKRLTKSMNKKQLLRENKVAEEEGDIPVDPNDKLAEEELKISLNHKKSALLDHPHVETQGKYDFLVLDSDVYDHFVTVIPNAMYQRVEKKCVNWLDDCSLKGIRTRLLRGVRSPYR